MSSSSLSDKVAVVTGASGGIGAAIALETVKADIEEKVGADARVLVVQTDVTSREQMQNLVHKAEEAFGPVDILVNNAGVMHVQLMKNLDQDSWDRMIDINCKGTLNGVAAVLPKMLARKSGHIVNISSDAGRKVFAGLGVYSASKMFIEGISQALRLENVGSGLRVTSIQPGDVTTFLVDHANAVSGVDEGHQDVRRGTRFYTVSPFSTMTSDVDVSTAECEELQPEDVGRVVLYAVTQPHYVAVNEVLVQPRDRSV
ncbi:hypothetical protein PR002_g18321 [Phytophthora rubi]|uniref:NADP-dependent 3-hydroxy acid dehydrogenase YdfG n=1 Tax=Phytophthora rubi TaxID=129364 RepID=A0A6A3K1L9_9STRA|nr:hypothetical protein PR002_g18321 [Phytophthora rubi]